VRIWAAVLLVVLAAPSGASAHPLDRPHGGYVSTISSVSPPVLGVQVAVLGGDQRLRLTNVGKETIVILNAVGRPFLRFADGAVRQYDAVAREWKQVATGTTYDWPEPRISWNESAQPPVVAADPNEAHVIQDWAIPARADGVPFQIKGILSWAPHATGPDAAVDPAGGRAFLIAFGVTAAAILAGGLLYVSRRRTSSSSRSA
jgi:hypothetical protein